MTAPKAAASALRPLLGRMHVALWIAAGLYFGIATLGGSSWCIPLTIYCGFKAARVLPPND